MKIKVGTDVVVNGRWAQVEEIFNATTGEPCNANDGNVSLFVVDQDGESREIGLDSIDHVY